MKRIPLSARAWVLLLLGMFALFLAVFPGWTFSVWGLRPIGWDGVIGLVPGTMLSLIVVFVSGRSLLQAIDSRKALLTAALVLGVLGLAIHLIFLPLAVLAAVKY